MQINLTTDYALRILVFLTLKNKVVNSKEIADSLDIPQKKVLSIGRKLKAAKYVNIVNGPYGGYIIVKKPEDILLYDIVLMFESVRVNFHSERKRGGDAAVDVPVITLYSELRSLIEEKLKSETLADLVWKETDNPAG